MVIFQSYLSEMIHTIVFFCVCVYANFIILDKWRISVQELFKTFKAASYTSNDSPRIYATVPYMVIDKDLLWMEGFEEWDF